MRSTDGDPAAEGHRLGRDRRSSSASSCSGGRQRPRRDEGQAFPHRPPGLLRLPGHDRDHRKRWSTCWPSWRALAISSTAGAQSSAGGVRACRGRARQPMAVSGVKRIDAGPPPPAGRASGERSSPGSCTVGGLVSCGLCENFYSCDACRHESDFSGNMKAPVQVSDHRQRQAAGPGGSPG